jgi:hypothetical protein
MNRITTAVFVVLLATGAVAQDKIGKDKAPTVLKKALAEAAKKKSSAITESAELAAGPRRAPASVFEGVLRKDFVAVKGAAEVYGKGATYLVNLGGRFDPPDAVEGQEATVAMSFRNPSLLLEELARNSAPPQFGPDEMVNGKDCKAVDVALDPALTKQYLKEFGDRMNKALRGAGGGFAQVFDLKNAMDEKNTAGSYHVLIGKEDLLIYQINFVIRPRIKPGALPREFPVPDDMMQKIDVKFSKYDEENPFEIPAVVKAKWGIK